MSPVAGYSERLDLVVRQQILADIPDFVICFGQTAMTREREGLEPPAF